MDENRVRVTGGAARVVVADLAKVTVSVQELDPDPRAAYDRCAPRVNEVARGLAEVAGDDGRVVPRTLTVQHHWTEAEHQGGPRMHAATCPVLVETAADRVGTVLATAIGLGADVVEGVDYRVGDADAILEELLSEAVAAARRKAERLGEAAGRPLGAIVAIKEPLDDGWREVGDAISLRSGRSMAEKIDFVPAEIRLAKSVRVTFALG
jgi:uncharacterized protein YggE